MIKMYAPKDVEQVTVQTQNFKVSKDRTVTVPEAFENELRAIGFKSGGAITVSADTAAAIKNTAKGAAAADGAASAGTAVGAERPELTGDDAGKDQKTDK